MNVFISVSDNNFEKFASSLINVLNEVDFEAYNKTVVTDKPYHMFEF